MRPYRGLTKEGKWVKGGLYELGDRAFILQEYDIGQPSLFYGFNYPQENFSICLIEVDPKTVGQATGLKDKTGKEIYKGDIVQDDDNRLPHLGKSKYEVIFEIKPWSSEFRFQVLPHRKWTYGGHGKFLEVIGNIHENPKLLEERAK